MGAAARNGFANLATYYAVNGYLEHALVHLEVRGPGRACPGACVHLRCEL